MGRAIFTGLIWGGMVGFGILTAANEIVAPVTLGSGTAQVDATNEDATHEDAGSLDVEPADAVTADTAALDPAPGDAAPRDAAQVDTPDLSIVTPKAPEGDTPPDVAAQIAAAEPNRSGTKPEVTFPDAREESKPAPALGAASAPSIAMPRGPASAMPEAGQSPSSPLDIDAATAQMQPVLPPPQALAPEAGSSDRLPMAGEALPEVGLLPEGGELIPNGPPSDVQLDARQKDTVEKNVVEKAPAPGDTVTPAMPEMPQMPVESAAGHEQPTVLAPTGQMQMGERVGSFTDREDARKSVRLPSIGPSGASEETDAPLVMAEDLPAILAYSADYAGGPAGPMLSIVLVDVGELGPEDAILTKLPFPVTYAVDAVTLRAGERAKSYRDKGLEVLAMVSLPTGATPQDAAVTLQQAAALVPVSIGFLDVPSATFQTSRTVAAQVVATAHASGRGILTFPRGLNSLEQEAQRADVPAALVFRDFDGRGQDRLAIKRFLDQAAFRANIDEKIVLLGRAKPETIQALAEWSLGNRAAAVSIVPLSYLLTH